KKVAAAPAEASSPRYRASRSPPARRRPATMWATPQTRADASVSASARESPPAPPEERSPSPSRMRRLADRPMYAPIPTHGEIGLAHLMDARDRSKVAREPAACERV